MWYWFAIFICLGIIVYLSIAYIVPRFSETINRYDSIEEAVAHDGDWEILDVYQNEKVAFVVAAGSKSTPGDLYVIKDKKGWYMPSTARNHPIKFGYTEDQVMYKCTKLNDRYVIYLYDPWANESNIPTDNYNSDFYSYTGFLPGILNQSPVCIYAKILDVLPEDYTLTINGRNIYFN